MRELAKVAADTVGFAGVAKYAYFQTKSTTQKLMDVPGYRAPGLNSGAIVVDDCGATELQIQPSPRLQSITNAWNKRTQYSYALGRRNDHTFGRKIVA